uniref:NADH dehydrogenase subunit 6 n=1 Tax=Eosembia sp. FS-2017 TaxID=2021303 RepID=A0A678RTR4_9NEOP|nr:NADH dehydrogenase subunit 6 [Eosembia sp. FS-2017]
MISLSILMSMTFLYFTHPLMLTIIILSQTLNSCMILGKILKNFWIPYMIIIIMLGGLMIMFVYMCSTSPNQIMMKALIQIKFKSKLLMIFMLTVISIKLLMKKLKIMPLNYSNTIDSEINMFNILMNFPNHKLFPIMMMILLFLMFISMKISASSESPLRSTTK